MTNLGETALSTYKSYTDNLVNTENILTAWFESITPSPNSESYYGENGYALSVDVSLTRDVVDVVWYLHKANEVNVELASLRFDHTEQGLISWGLLLATQSLEHFSNTSTRDEFERELQISLGNIVNHLNTSKGPVKGI